MPSYAQTLPVNTSVARLWALVGDVAKLAAVFPYITIDDLTTTAPACWRYWRQMRIPNVADLRWREEAAIVEPGTLVFHAIEGDVETFTGVWRVGGNEQAATLDFTVEYDVPSNVATNVPAFMVPLMMNELFKAICTRVKEVAEEDA